MKLLRGRLGRGVRNLETQQSNDLGVLSGDEERKLIDVFNSHLHAHPDDDEAKDLEHKIIIDSFLIGQSW